VQRYADEQLLQRPITPEEIGEAVLFLATSTATTGQALNVDGGWAFS
jgi:NAD(P)-dependent dehydrogenase (short-subunit alcohol dehydrogenase family)